MQRRIERSVARYLSELDSADRRGEAEFNEAHTQHLEDKLAKLQSEMKRMQDMGKAVTKEYVYKMTSRVHLIVTSPSVRVSCVYLLPYCLVSVSLHLSTHG